MSTDPDMLEAHYLDNLWKMLVACILLNRSKRAQVDKVIDILFERWPTPEAMASASEREVSECIRSIGFQHTKASRLVLMSSFYMSTQPYDLDSVAALPGIGAFGLEAYRIFYLRQEDFIPTDKELRKYLEWKKSK
jgi:endonuclease III